MSGASEQARVTRPMLSHPGFDLASDIARPHAQVCNPPLSDQQIVDELIKLFPRLVSQPGRWGSQVLPDRADDGTLRADLLTQPGECGGHVPRTGSLDHT